MNSNRRTAGTLAAAAALAVAGLSCGQVSEPEAYQVRVILPAQYQAQPSRTWPTLVALHGAGGPVDQDFEDAVAQDPNFPFILVLPRGRDGGFASSSVRQTLEAELPKYRVDNDRMYITGFSAGAYTAWRVAAGWPERFAAIVLIAGGGLDELACAVKEVPVWLIHNTNDSVVPASESIELADAIRACSGIVTLTLLEAPPGGTGHNAWSQYYRSLSFYDWLLQHRLGEPSATQQFTARAASR